MGQGTRRGRFIALVGTMAGMALVPALPLVTTAAGQAAAGETLTVNLASPRGPATGAQLGDLHQSLTVHTPQENR